MVKYQLQIGNGVLSFENPDPKVVHRFGAAYGALPQVCDACKSKRIHLSHKNPKENDYYTIKCADCGAELALHEKKKGGFYLKAGEKMEVYKKDESEKAEPANQESKPQKENDDDNPPF
jgi:hypothetical protein